MVYMQPLGTEIQSDKLSRNAHLSFLSRLSDTGNVKCNPGYSSISFHLPTPPDLKSFEVCTIKVPLVDCCLQILFGPMLRVTTTYISLCSYRAEMLKKYLARTVENVDCRYQMKSLYSIMHSEWSESANVVM